jgi:hypothetical protein
MVEAVLKFSLPADQDVYVHANNGASYYRALCNFQAAMKKIRKLQDINPYNKRLYESIEDEFTRIMRDFDIKLF